MSEAASELNIFEYEHALLGCLITDYEHEITKVFSELSPKDFISPNDSIYLAVETLFKSNSEVHELGVKQWLEGRGLLEKIGGFPKIISLASGSYNRKFVDDYVAHIKENSRARQLNRIVQRYEEGANPDTIIRQISDLKPREPKPAQVAPIFDGTNLAFLPIAEGVFGCNDGANATRFVAQHGMNVRYVAAIDTWFIWDGTRWRPDEDGCIFELARLTAESIAREPKPSDPDMAKAHANWVSTSRNYNKLVAMLNSARTRNGIRCRLQDFDTELHMINCANGVVNLKTGQRVDHSRDFMFSKLIDIDYDAKATCDEWETFLMSAMGDDWDMIGFLQRAIGFALSGTGTTVEQKFFVCWGKAGSGKSTFINTIGKIMGDWGTNVDSDMFMQKFQKDNQFNPIHLVGKRYISVNELGENEKFDMKFLKTFTGGDPASGRELYSKKVVQYMPQGSVFMRSNHRPIAGSDTGFWRRILMVPFSNPVKEEKFDTEIPDRLLKELKGILAWAVAGAMEWYRIKLSAPDKVKLVTKEYELEQDYLGECISENFEVGAFPAISCVGLEQTYQFYEWWADKTGNPKLKQRKLTEELRSRGFERDRTNIGFVWRGLKLITEMPEKRKSRYRQHHEKDDDE